MDVAYDGLAVVKRGKDAYGVVRDLMCCEVSLFGQHSEESFGRVEGYYLAVCLLDQFKRDGGGSRDIQCNIV